jgi:phenylpropionate dioxygenase-like ring-hydroxylating dioxygenase large terminal subunit
VTPHTDGSVGHAHIPVSDRSADPGLYGVADEGATLPCDWYTDPAIFRLERERIFHRSWQYVGHADRVRHPGDHFRARIGDIPVAVVRDQDRELRAYVNVCRHRQHEVVSGEGNRGTLQCPYHGWTYNLDGSLRAAPRCDLEPGFDASRYSLRSLRVDTWGPLIFANPANDGPTLAEVLGPLPALAQSRGLDFGPCAHRATRQHEFHCNWKVYVDNAIECYHCPIAHPALSRIIDVRPEAYKLETYEWASAQLSRRREPSAGGGSSGPQEQPAFQFYYIWPNLFLGTATGKESYALHYLEPLDVEHSRLTIEYYFSSGIDDATSDEEVAFNTTTLIEDRQLVESVQRGLRSGLIPRGQLMLNSESLLQHFQSLVVRALSG